MIRLILKRTSHDFNADLRQQRFETLDCEIPELEAALNRGGQGEMGFDYTECVGVEVIASNQSP